MRCIIVHISVHICTKMSKNNISYLYTTNQMRLHTIRTYIVVSCSTYAWFSVKIAWKRRKLRHTKLSVRIWIVCLLEFRLVNIHSVDWHQHFDRKNYHQFQFASVFIEYLTFISNIMQSYNNNSYNKHGKIRRGERKSKTVIRYNRRKRPSLWRIDGSCFLSK